jgi:hypothetical protein
MERVNHQATECRCVAAVSEQSPCVVHRHPLLDQAKQHVAVIDHVRFSRRGMSGRFGYRPQSAFDEVADDSSPQPLLLAGLAGRPSHRIRQLAKVGISAVLHYQYQCPFAETDWLVSICGDFHGNWEHRVRIRRQGNVQQQLFCSRVTVRILQASSQLVTQPRNVEAIQASVISVDRRWCLDGKRFQSIDAFDAVTKRRARQIRWKR